MYNTTRFPELDFKVLAVFPDSLQGFLYNIITRALPEDEVEEFFEVFEKAQVLTYTPDDAKSDYRLEIAQYVVAHEYVLMILLQSTNVMFTKLGFDTSFSLWYAQIQSRHQIPSFRINSVRVIVYEIYQVLKRNEGIIRDTKFSELYTIPDT